MKKMELTNKISDFSVRGRLGSVFPVARNIGILLSNIAAAFVDYEHRPCIFIAFPIIFFILVNFLPSTPEYYLQSGHIVVRSCFNLHDFFI